MLLQTYEKFWFQLIKLILEVSFQPLTGIRGIYIHLMLNAVSWLTAWFVFQIQSPELYSREGLLVCGSSLRLLYYEIMLD